MASVWKATAKKQAFPALCGDAATDVLIIGGGMAGVLTAYLLERAGVDYLLCEAEEIGGGVTQNTTAKITYQHGLLYDRLIRTFGERNAALYLHANEEALETYRALCAQIDCSFETKDHTVYSLYDAKQIEKELRALKKLGVPARRTDAWELPFDAADAVTVPHQAQFHPLRFLGAIAENLHIYAHTRVRELKKTGHGITAVTSGGTVSAKRAVVAAHFPFLNKHGLYFMKLYQHRSYVIALENADRLDGMYLDADAQGLSFRNFGNLLLLGGGSHRTGRDGGGYRELKEVAELYYSGAAVRYAWAAQDCMTLDSVPYIGRYASGTEGLYVATGFNKWGMTGSMVAAKLLCDLLTGTENPYAKLFSPARSMLHPTLFANAAAFVFDMLKPTTPRCPHLGCALHWNDAEQTWDCPCHGSRFAADGSLIDNPATGDLKGLRK